MLAAISTFFPKEPNSHAILALKIWVLHTNHDSPEKSGSQIPPNFPLKPQLESEEPESKFRKHHVGSRVTVLNER